MDKKSIQSAIDAILLLRHAQQEPNVERTVQIPLAPGADTPIFKNNISNARLAKIGISFHDQDLQIPQRAGRVIKNALDKAGYKPDVQYSEQQIHGFSELVAQDLQTFISSFGDILEDLAV